MPENKKKTRPENPLCIEVFSHTLLKTQILKKLGHCVNLNKTECDNVQQRQYIEVVG